VFIHEELTRVTGTIFTVILLGTIFYVIWKNGSFVSQVVWGLGSNFDNNSCRPKEIFNFTSSEKNSRSLQ